jgi:hypothetical protein
MHQKCGPGRLFETLFDYDDGRRQRFLCALSLLLLLLITPLAYARACDSTWIPGLYDEADYDDVVLFLIETAGSTVPGPGALAVSAPAMRGLVFPSVHVRSQRPRAEISRGPPPIKLRSLRFCASPRLCNSVSQHRISLSLGRGPPLDTLKRIGPCQGSVLTSALEELPDHYRAVVILHDVEACR